MHEIYKECTYFSVKKMELVYKLHIHNTDADGIDNNRITCVVVVRVPYIPYICILYRH